MKLIRSKNDMIDDEAYFLRLHSFLPPHRRDMPEEILKEKTKFREKRRKTPRA